MRTSLLITTLLLASFTVGCDDDSSSSSSSSATTDAGSTADTAADTVTQEGSYCELNPVTEANQFCASVLVPADMEGAVEKVSVHFFSTFPPAGPPSFMGQ